MNVHTEDVDSIGARIRRKRRDVGLSQEALAREMGVSKNTVARWETNVHPPTGENFSKLADRFGVTTDWLLRGDQAPSPKPSPAPERPEWREFRERYEYIGEFTDEQLADIESFAARQIEIKSWMDYVLIAETVRRARPSPTFEAKRAAHAARKSRQN